MRVEMIRECQREVLQITVVRRAYNKESSGPQRLVGSFEQYARLQKMLDHLNRKHRIIAPSKSLRQRIPQISV